MRVREGLLLLAFLLAAPAAQALNYAAGPAATLAVEPSPDAIEATSVLRIHLDAAASAYVLVLSTPGNAAFRNGTFGGAGWWTAVSLGSGPGAVEKGVLDLADGDNRVDLGALPAGDHDVQFRIHAPAGALAADGASHDLAYAVATQAGGGSGSGSTIDPSLGWLPDIVAVAGTDSGPDAAEATTEGASGSGGEGNGSETDPGAGSGEASPAPDGSPSENEPSEDGPAPSGSAPAPEGAASIRRSQESLSDRLFLPAVGLVVVAALALVVVGMR